MRYPIDFEQSLAQMRVRGSSAAMEIGDLFEQESSYWHNPIESLAWHALALTETADPWPKIDALMSKLGHSDVALAAARATQLRGHLSAGAPLAETQGHLFKPEPLGPIAG